MTMENVLAAHALARLDKTVISNAVHYLRFCKTVRETVAALESSNRYLAQCRDLHPDKFVMMATCVPGGGDECLKERSTSGVLAAPRPRSARTISTTNRGYPSVS